MEEGKRRPTAREWKGEEVCESAAERGREEVLSGERCELFSESLLFFTPSSEKLSVENAYSGKI